MIPKWKDRPVTVANLLNPAFCGEILRTTMKSYSTETDKAFPYALSFLILPFLLNNQIREVLPTKTSKKFYEWLEENTIIRINLANNIKNLVPYTRDSILFLIYHESLKINNNGELEINKYRKKQLNYIADKELEDIYKKAIMFGKWLSKMGNIKTIYVMLGIKP